MIAQTLPETLSGTIEAVFIVAKKRTGKRPSPATVWRWCRKGVRGGSIKLAAIFHGGRWQTTPQAFDEFLAKQTSAALNDDADAKDCDQSETADSDAALHEMGLL